MSQYPSPYSGPNVPFSGAYGWDPYGQWLAPARRAGMLMIVLGVLSLMCGACSLAGSFAGQSPEAQEQLRQWFPDMQTPSQQQSLVSVMLYAACGAILVTLGLFVRRGSRGATVGSIVLAALLLVFLVLNMLGAMVLSSRAGGGQIGPMLVGVGCMALVTIGPIVWLLVWLIQALQSTGQIQAIQQQYAAQYWQYMQQQQRYSQPPSGQQPPPPPLPPREDDKLN